MFPKAPGCHTVRSPGKCTLLTPLPTCGHDEECKPVWRKVTGMRCHQSLGSSWDQLIPSNKNYMEGDTLMPGDIKKQRYKISAVTGSSLIVSSWSSLRWPQEQREQITEAHTQYCPNTSTDTIQTSNYGHKKSKKNRRTDGRLYVWAWREHLQAANNKVLEHR